jgi:hypothetical protein
MPITTVTTVLPIGGTGTYTIVDTTAAAIEAQTIANGLMFEKYFGTTATKASASGLTAQAANTATNTKAMLKKFDNLTDKFEQLQGSVGSVSKGSGDVLTALANIQFTLLETKTIQTLAYADQMRNNKFQQKATNQALVDAGKPPIKVEPEEITASAKQALDDVASINAQVALVNIVQKYAIAGITEGYKISTQWIAQSSFGQWIEKYYKEAKLTVKGLFADEKIKRETETKVIESINTINSPVTPTA